MKATKILQILEMKLDTKESNDIFLEFIVDIEKIFTKKFKSAGCSVRRQLSPDVFADFSLPVSDQNIKKFDRPEAIKKYTQKFIKFFPKKNIKSNKFLELMWIKLPFSENLKRRFWEYWDIPNSLITIRIDYSNWDEFGEVEICIYPYIDKMFRPLKFWTKAESLSEVIEIFDAYKTELFDAVDRTTKAIRLTSFGE